MLEITIPNNNIPERRYIIATLLSEFLGLDYTIRIDDNIEDYVIRFNESELIIVDGFFGLYPEDLSYLNEDALPEEVRYAKVEFISETDIPVVYGVGEIDISPKKIRCEIDVFASSFLMLTRWEEIVNKTRDARDRFPGTDSVAFKSGFLNRPVVNEYVELLWQMLSVLGYMGERKSRKFELVLTHDVDSLSYVSLRSIMGDVIKRKDLRLAFHNMKYLVHDPHNTYDFLMNISEKLGVSSHFYFMSETSDNEHGSADYLKRGKFKSLIKEIARRGHIVGFHPGYNTYKDSVRWRKEKARLEEAAHMEVNEGRQHYLRMDISKTLSIWEKHGMKIDSTLSYADNEGFRCGTGDMFPVFACLTREQFELKERPLIVMDGTLKQYQKYSPEKAIEVIQYYITLGKKYNSAITLLFHNSSFALEWKDYKAVYSELLNMKI